MILLKWIQEGKKKNTTIKSKAILKLWWFQWRWLGLVTYSNTVEQFTQVSTFRNRKLFQQTSSPNRSRLSHKSTCRNQKTPPSSWSLGWQCDRVGSGNWVPSFVDSSTVQDILCYVNIKNLHPQAIGTRENQHISI